MESESLLRRVAAPVQLPPTHKETKESQTEQHNGRSPVRHEHQLVLSGLSMIAVAPQIENAHTVVAVVVVQVVRETHDKCAKSVVRISAFTFQPPNRRLQGCRAGVATWSRSVVVSGKRALSEVQVEPRRSPGNGIRIATRNAAIDGSLADSVIEGRAGGEMLIVFHAEGFEACVGWPAL